MERLNDEIGWNQLRYDIRTYTAQNERNRRGGEAGKVPDGYKYIGDRCFLNNGKVHEVVLPEEMIKACEKPLKRMLELGR